MDHEVVPGHCKCVDWLLKSSWDHFGLHRRKQVKVTMEFEVPKRHILRPTFTTDMVQQVLQWESKRGALVQKGEFPWHVNDLIIFFLNKRSMGKRGRRQENGQTWFFFISKLPFLGTYSKKSTHSLLVHDHSSCFTFSLHLVRGLETF